MKELIRSILKEEVNQTNNPKLNKLMKIFVSAMKSEFPFVTGWVAKNDPNNPNSSFLTVGLIIDPDEAKEFYGLPYSYWYDDINFRNKIINGERSFAYPFSLLKVGENEDKWEMYQPFHEHVSFIYDEIPDILKPTYEYQSPFEDDPTNVPKMLDVDGFVFKK